MLELKAGSIVKQGVPPAFRYRCAIRCTDAKHAYSQKTKNPMIVSNWELIGYFDENNNLKSEITRSGVKYKLDGLKLPTLYQTLTEQALPYYADWYSKANPGETLTQLDEKDPNMTFYENLIMQAVVEGGMNVVRRILSEEELNERKAKGESEQGEALLDEKGNPIENPVLRVIYNGWLGRYVGELPEGVVPF